MPRTRWSCATPSGADFTLHFLHPPHGSALAEIIPVADVVPRFIRKFCVPTAGSVVAAKENITPTLFGTVVNVFAYVASELNAPSVVYAVEVNAWNPSVYFTAGAIRIGTGNVNTHAPAVVEVVVVQAVPDTTPTSA